MYCNRMLGRTSCRAANAFNVSHAVQAAFCWQARPASRVVATAALRVRRSSVGRDAGHERRRTAGKEGGLLRRGSGHVQVRERSTLGSQEEVQHGGQTEADTAAAERMGHYETLLQGPSVEFSARSYREVHTRGPEDARNKVRGEACVTPTAQTRGRLTEEFLVADGRNTATSWTGHMQRFSQNLRDRKWKDDKTPGDLDYVGLPITPESSPLDSPLPVPWALTVHERQGLTAAQMLDEEILRFNNYMKPTLKERHGRFLLHDTANKRICSGLDLKKTRVFTFGSTATKLDLPFSDIDFAVNTRGATPQQHGRELEKLSQRLKEGKDFICVVFRSGKFPIITAQHVQSGLDIQVVAGVEESTSRKTYSLLDNTPQLRSLYSVVRMMFGTRGFVNPFIGGISAFGAMQMIAVSIKLQEASAASPVPESAASRLLHYLDLYANLDTTKHALSARSPFIVPKHADKIDTPIWNHLPMSSRFKDPTFCAEAQRLAQTDPKQPYLLSLQDSTNPINDLGARCHAIKHILRTIQHLNAELRSSMQRYDLAREQGEPVQGDFSLLLPLVGRCHEVYAERRAKLVEYSRRRKGGSSRPLMKLKQSYE